MTRKRFIGYALASTLLALLLTTVGLVAADLLLHQTRHAVNIWGYRGPIARAKQPNEWRLVVLGESTAYGYGVRWEESFPAYLQQALNAPGSTRRVTVVNLAYNNEGAYSYKFTLSDYEYLQYDAVLIYGGYNDLGGANTSVFRHQSPVFRLTGYLPLLPFFLHEKASVLRGGSVEDAEKRAHFDPNLSGRATAAALEKAAQISRTLEAQLGAGPVAAVHDLATKDGAACGPRWAHFCGGMYQAITAARQRGKAVIVATQPYYNWEHEEQQARFQEFLRLRFGGDPRVQLADLGHGLSLKDSALCYDGLHLTPEGNRRISAALTPYVRQLMP